MFIRKIRKLSEEAALRPISAVHALALANARDGEEFWALLDGADRLRVKFRGAAVSLCSIVNAKSGRCGEDCAFCAQSARFHTDIEKYGFVGAQKILDAASRAAAAGAREFSIVVSGRRIRDAELDEALEAIPRIATQTGMSACASLGVIGERDLGRLKDAGLRMFHHNLETAASFYPKICTTRTYESNRETVAVAKRCGLFVCSGGIFGMGETWEQRIELLMDLRDLDVDSVPINFLNPIPGTPLAEKKSLTPRECLKIIALARHILPAKQIVVCGGREVNLRDMQSLIFHAGASAMMIGDYLTTKGRDPRADRRMLEDLGLPVKENLMPAP